jgi:hypothetical protein
MNARPHHSTVLSDLIILYFICFSYSDHGETSEDDEPAAEKSICSSSSDSDYSGARGSLKKTRGRSLKSKLDPNVEVLLKGPYIGKSVYDVLKVDNGELVDGRGKILHIERNKSTGVEKFIVSCDMYL